MGIFKAFTDSVGGTFADQWLEYYEPLSTVSSTAAVFPAVKRETNNDRGENYKGSDNVITNGSKFNVPEGTALITIQDGEITGFIDKPGKYVFTTVERDEFGDKKNEEINSSSVFSSDGFFDAVKGLGNQTIERFKHGGQASTEQLAFYVNLKEIPNNRFGTQSEIYWDDAYFGTQVGAITRGTYTLKIQDPVLFIKNFVPLEYLTKEGKVFDFADMDNKAGEQLFNEVVSTLTAAFSIYTNDPAKGNRMSRIQGDQIGFAQAMAQAVETAYKWKEERGLEIVKTAILAIEYDEDTKELMKDVKKADALSGARGNSFMQQSVARGMQSAGENGGGTGMAFMGMGMNATGGMMSGMQQPQTQSSYQPNFGQPMQPTQPVQEMPISNPMQQQSVEAPVDSTTRLLEMKKLLDAGAITQEDYDAVKKQILGI